MTIMKDDSYYWFINIKGVMSLNENSKIIFVLFINSCPLIYVDKFECILYVSYNLILEWLIFQICNKNCSGDTDGRVQSAPDR